MQRIISWAQTHRLAITAFISSAALLITEILGFNIVGAYFGTALVVQSNLLALVLLALALGYWRGGELARTNAPDVARSLLCRAGISLFALFSLRDVLGGAMRALVPTPSYGSALFIALLFFLPAYYLGALLPVLIAIAPQHMASAGKTIGKLYFASGMGSVAGALVFVFFVTPLIGTSATLFCASAVLFFCALFFGAPRRRVLIYATLSGILFFTGSFLWLDYYPGGAVSFDGDLRVDRNALRRIDDASTPYARVQVYEGVELEHGKTLRFLKINRETHSATFLDSNELVFRYAKYNRLGGHFNPSAQKALLIGGGGYSYANYFLGDTPLFDKERIWHFMGRLYNNKQTISLPFLASSDPATRVAQPRIVFEAPSFPSERARIESSANSIAVTNQKPDAMVRIRRADIQETGFDEPFGYVHVHEVDKHGLPGAVVSSDVQLKPHNIIGHSERFSGTKEEVVVPLDRPAREGEVLYAMLHRDNGNGRFDPILVDAYEQIERLDVVEIDPQTTAFAEKYFHLNRQDPRLRIFHEDGRTFLNKTKERYDIIYLDAFRSFYSVPHQLATTEALQATFNALNPGGVVVANIPAALTGENGRFFQSEYRTFKEVFPVVKIFASGSPNHPDLIQNIILVAFKNADRIRTSLNDDDEINEQLKNEWHGKVPEDAPILTDDYAPVDYLINKFSDIKTF